MRKIPTGAKQSQHLGHNDRATELLNIKTKKPEFLEWKWINLEDITKNVVDFKLDVYNEVKKKVLDILK